MNGFKSGKKCITVGQPGSHSLFQGFLDGVAIALSGKQPRKTVPVSEDIQALDLQLILFNRQFRRNFSVKISASERWQAGEILHEIQRDANFGNDPIVGNPETKERN